MQSFSYILRIILVLNKRHPSKTRCAWSNVVINSVVQNNVTSQIRNERIYR